jgi:hypothetical protein
MNADANPTIETRRISSHAGLFKQLALALLCSGILCSGQAADDWVSVYDAKDMADSSGDIHSISARVKGDSLYLAMTVENIAAPSVAETAVGMVNRYYYHWLLDTDNNPATGRSNAEYEGAPTGVTKPVGSELFVQIGWRDGHPDGIQVYDPLNDTVLIVTNFSFQASGNTLTAVLPLAAVDLTPGQTIAFSAFQEGASDGWAVDWMESATLTLGGLPFSSATVLDPKDMADTSGDIHAISAHVEGTDLLLAMTVENMAAPSVEQTPVGMVNRYYYHWLLDTDNNPATGRSNAEYEGVPTGVTKPVGSELFVQIGWRDGHPDGIQVYDPLNDAVLIVTNFTFHASGNTLTARLRMADLGLVDGQTIAVSAFQEGASDGWSVDWMESATLTLTGPTFTQASVTDPKDMADASGDIHAISAHVEGQNLVLSMSVENMAAPPDDQTAVGMVNRYYYHWLLDTDNNPATGRSNAEYEGVPTGVTKPVGSELFVQIGWRDGHPDGIQVYDPLNDSVLIVTNFTFQASGNTLTAVVPLADLDLAVGQTIAVSAFQEGASDGWSVDWMESATLTLTPPSAGRMKIDGLFTDWADAATAGLVTSVSDPSDMADSSGDIKQIQATVESGYLYLRMAVHGIALPSVDQTPAGMVNRYYYHWLLDTDNNPATGRRNSEYEGIPTGVTNPVGSELFIQIGWRNGAPDGVQVYDPLNDTVLIVTNYEYQASGDSVEARLKLADLKLSLGQTIAISAFQEGASDGWAVDWMESATLTLADSGSANMTLVNYFLGDAYGYRITVEDTTSMVVDTTTVVVRVDGELAQATVSKVAGVTTITGVYPELFPPDSLHKVALSLLANSTPQSKEYVYRVDPYTVLPLTHALKQLNTNNKGFIVRVSRISSAQIGEPGVRSVHSNIAAYAELQLSGLVTNPLTAEPYFNEPESDYSKWVLTPVTNTGTVNWFELAPDQQASLNFPGDVPFPRLDASMGALEGIALDILTYVELPQGYHKFGLYTEGGHAIYAGLTSSDPLINVLDNSVIENVPTYYARSRFFNVVAPESGYYPLRFLYFQEARSQEPGLMLELFSERDRALHLLNDSANPKSLRAFRAGPLVGNGTAGPALTVQRANNQLTIGYAGMLQWANSPMGPWNNYADASQSPVTVTVAPGAKFFRAISY